jgi:hypothetical protein
VNDDPERRALAEPRHDVPAHQALISLVIDGYIGRRAANGGPGAAAAATKKVPIFATSTSHISISLKQLLVRPEERAHVHDDPERRALAQPRHDVAARARSAGPSRLAHHAGAHDESNVWLQALFARSAFGTCTQPLSGGQYGLTRRGSSTLYRRCI